MLAWQTMTAPWRTPEFIVCGRWTFFRRAHGVRPQVKPFPVGQHSKVWDATAREIAIAALTAPWDRK
jgi:hypothetical protein